MKQMILGTAGHIDHGKTSLIKAITGVNTDRLKEEQLRGITIELGFADLTLPGGQHLGIVDVPGHEKFVKNMVAGATGIDMVVMVIAADEGVMPQTTEHMEICSLLGIEYGLIALTKIDMVDEEWLELVTEDVREFSEGTFLEDAPIVPVSAATGQGIEAFISALDRLSLNIPDRTEINIFRLPVDRVFSMRGFGTVITGTLISGEIGVGDSVMIFPEGITSRVRGIQVHNAAVERAGTGMRTAINFQGLDKSVVERGAVVSTPDALAPSYMVDLWFNYLKSNRKPVKNRTQVRFHTGTSEVLGNLILFDRDELAPGESLPVQVRLDTPVVLVRDDRFVIRSYSPVRTIGGGKVINPIPKKHRRFRPGVMEGLMGLMDADPESLAAAHTAQAGFEGVRFAELKLMANLSDKPLNNLLGGLLSSRTLVQMDKESRTFVHKEAVEKLRKGILNHLERYHEANPLKAGMSKEEVKSKFPPTLGVKLFNLTLQGMAKDQEIAQEEKTVRLATHSVSLGVDGTDIRDKIVKTYRESGLTPPYYRDLAAELSMDPARAKDMLGLLKEEGELIKAKEDLYFHQEAIEGLQEKILLHFAANESLTPADMKAMTGLSRKYLIPLLELFDGRNLTIRVGDVRKLRRG